MARFEPAEGKYAALINFKGQFRLDEVVCHYLHVNWCSQQVGHMLTKTEENGGTFQETGWIIGIVIEAKATKPIDSGEVISSTNASNRRGREPKLRPADRAPRMIRSRPATDLFSLPTHGTA